MPPDEQSTQAADAQALQQPDNQNAQAHSEESDSKKPSTFDARKAFDSTNERLNKVAAKIDKIDPDVLQKIADKLGITQEQAEQKVEDKSPDVRSIVSQEIWQATNAERIAKANENGRYEAYVSEGIKPDRALRLAEQDLGVVVDTSEQTRQKKASSADAPVDRTGPGPTPYRVGEYGITQKDIENLGAQAQKVRIYR